MSSPLDLPILTLVNLFIRESESEVAQSCPTLCDPMDVAYQAPLFMGLFQAVVLEWIPLNKFRKFSLTDIVFISENNLTVA